MARIRTIKPQFFMSETLGSISRDARLLFASMFCQADREGRMRWVPRLVLGSTFPYDEDLGPEDLERLAVELESVGSIFRWREDGKGYAVVVNFTDHQRVKGNEAASRLPVPPSSDGAHCAPPRRPSGAAVASDGSVGRWKLEGGSWKVELEEQQSANAASESGHGTKQVDDRSGGVHHGVPGDVGGLGGSTGLAQASGGSRGSGQVDVGRRGVPSGRVENRAGDDDCGSEAPRRSGPRDDDQRQGATAPRRSAEPDGAQRPDGGAGRVAGTGDGTPGGGGGPQGDHERHGGGSGGPGDRVREDRVEQLALSNQPEPFDPVAAVFAEYKMHMSRARKAPTTKQSDVIRSALKDFKGAEDRAAWEICRDIIGWAFKADGRAAFLRAGDHTSLKSLLQARTREERRILSAKWISGETTKRITNHGIDRGAAYIKPTTIYDNYKPKPPAPGEDVPPVF